MRMSPSRRSSVSSASSESVENECFNFIVNKLSKYQPTTLSDLIGHLTCMPENLKSVVGTTNLSVRRYLRNYPEIFGFNEKGRVYLLDDSQMSGSRRIYRNNSHASHMLSGRGKITRLFLNYGFLKCDHPISAHVYFSSSCFPGEKKKILQDHCLSVGQTLGFDAKLGSPRASAEYQAIRVWIVPGGEDEEEEEDFDRCGKGGRHRKFNNTNWSNSTSVPPKHFKDKIFTEKSRNKAPHHQHRESDSNSMDVEKHSIGYIQAVFDHHGFIEEQQSSGKRGVFFHQNKIENLPEDINYLRDVLKKGDMVKYKAKHSAKKPDWWEAVGVWLMKDCVAPSTDEEIYVSSPELSGDEDNDMNESSESLAKQQPKNKITSQSSADLVDCEGEYHPISSTRAFIKYKEHEMVLADMKNCDFYNDLNKVDDLNWEFVEKDILRFDAVRMENDDGEYKWKAILVWVGEKPSVKAKMSRSHYIYTDSNNHESSSCNEDTEEPHTSSPVQEKDKISEENSDVTASASVEYMSWGDSPYLDDGSPGQKNDIDDSEEINGEENFDQEYNSEQEIYEEMCLPDNPGVGKDGCATRENNHCSIKRFLKQSSNEDNFLVGEKLLGDSSEIHELAEGTFTDTCIESDAGKKECGPVVRMYENLIGTIMKLSRYSIMQLSCADLEMPISVSSSVIYYGCVPIKEKCTDLTKLLSVGDKINFNYFIIIDDDENTWRKVTVAWTKGKPSKFKDMEPKDFIENQKLHVSCEIPTWRQFRNWKSDGAKTNGKNSQSPLRNNTDQEQKFLSKNIDSPSRSKGKFLTSACLTPEKHEKLSFLSEAQGPCGSSRTRKDHLTEIMEKLEKIRLHSSPDMNQVLDELTSEIEEALNTSSSQQKNNCQRRTSDFSCQTDAVPKTPSRILPQSITTNTAVQTLLTGDVISSKIFPH